MQEHRNLIVAIVASIVILLGFQFLYEMPRQQRERERQAAVQQTLEQTQPASTDLSQPPAPPGEGAPGLALQQPPSGTLTRMAALAGSARVPIRTPRVHGSIALTGGRIDDVTLATYRETVEPDSPEIILLSPPSAPAPYYAEFGWVAAQGANPGPLPGAQTTWSTTSAELTPASPVVLTWDNGQGLIFTRTIAIDGDFMFTVTDKVQNTKGEAVGLHPYGLVSRTGTPQTAGFFILHEGPVGVLDGTLKEPSYHDLQEAAIQQASTGGWIGITDKYWLATVIPDQATAIQGGFKHDMAGGRDRYQTDYLVTAPLTAPAGGTVESTARLFAGAKEVKLLDRYREDLGIARFDLAIDFGWFYFLTKPIFLVIDYFHKLLGNFGLAILLLTVIIKGFFFPLANKSYVSMSKMKKLQPEMMKLRERYPEDRMKQQQEMMALYKREKINPLAGCLPILIQIPVFFALYKVLFVTIEMRHAPFYGWIVDLSAPDPTHIFNLFGLIPWDPPHFLALGIWPILMGISMFLQQKLNPAPPDPIQAKIFLFMPILFTFMLASFPAGLVIYWTWNNLLSILQQWLIMRRMGVKVT
ncbi:membrane protein insertase YidC [Zavarzinia sp. CC-PAN008]|uniref:membrane protein insertase YidC n=1 Tax=Zavarzinia sp. CC-PAN008 TaxID=3243332 RepID=UPI003F74326D